MSSFAPSFSSPIRKKSTGRVPIAQPPGNDTRAWCMRDIHSKAKNVIWINPESPGAWGFGDSVMDKYLPYTDIAEECRNLKQLSRLVDKLIL